MGRFTHKSENSNGMAQAGLESLFVQGNAWYTIDAGYEASDLSVEQWCGDARP